MMFFTFAIFGEKMISIVVFGVFLLVLITCYPNIIKSELLIEMKAPFGGRLSSFRKGAKYTLRRCRPQLRWAAHKLCWSDLQELRQRSPFKVIAPGGFGHALLSVLYPAHLLPQQDVPCSRRELTKTHKVVKSGPRSPVLVFSSSPLSAVSSSAELVLVSLVCPLLWSPSRSSP